MQSSGSLAQHRIVASTLLLASRHFGDSDHKCSGLPLVATSCHIMPKSEPLVIVCGKTVQLTTSGSNFVLRDLLVT